MATGSFQYDIGATDNTKGAFDSVEENAEQAFGNAAVSAEQLSEAAAQVGDAMAEGLDGADKEVEALEASTGASFGRIAALAGGIGEILDPSSRVPSTTHPA